MLSDCCSKVAILLPTPLLYLNDNGDFEVLHCPPSDIMTGMYVHVG
jgi:hypothetical protein